MAIHDSRIITTRLEPRRGQLAEDLASGHSINDSQGKSLRDFVLGGRPQLVEDINASRISSLVSGEESEVPRRNP